MVDNLPRYELVWLINTGIDSSATLQSIPVSNSRSEADYLNLNLNLNLVPNCLDPQCLQAGPKQKIRTGVALYGDYPY